MAENSTRKSYLCPISTHAEIASIKKFFYKNNLSYYKKQKKPVHINLLVIRLTKSNELKNSRPCYHCIQTLSKLNIIIDKVYYSNQNGHIVCEKFRDMLESPENKMSSGYRKRFW